MSGDREARLDAIRAATGCGDNAEEVLRWMLESPGPWPETPGEFYEEARSTWEAVKIAAELVYGPRSGVAPALPRARDFTETPAAEWEAHLRERRADRNARLNALHTGTYKAGE